jgi:hypothetical protein
MKLNSVWLSPASLRGHFNTAPRNVSDSPQSRSRSIAEYRAGSTSEHSGHPSAPGSEGLMADRINPTMQWVEPPLPQPMLYGLAAETKFDQLAARHDSVLPRRKVGDVPVS